MMMSYNVLDLISSHSNHLKMSGQNVYFDVSVDNNPLGRITFKVKNFKFFLTIIIFVFS
jgi:hypothetical protein